MLKLVPLTRSEPGCLQYDLILDNKDPNFLTLIEKFANIQVFDEHERQSYIKNFLENFMHQYCEKVTWREGKEILADPIIDP